jgi:hypothetical protein
VQLGVGGFKASGSYLLLYAWSFHALSTTHHHTDKWWAAPVLTNRLQGVSQAPLAATAVRSHTAAVGICGAKRMAQRMAAALACCALTQLPGVQAGGRGTRGGANSDQRRQGVVLSELSIASLIVVVVAGRMPCFLLV